MTRVLAALALLLALAGCSGVSIVESVVTAYANWTPAPSAASYRFERLPSQQGALQDQVEAMVQPQLELAGWRRDEQAPRYLVQLGVRSQREDPLAWYGPWGPGFRRGPFGWSRPGPLYDAPLYEREVMLLIRDTSNNQLVYESHAAQDSRWADSEPVWRAMFVAALHEFPNPPPGTRRVGVQVTP
jgi:hypothetical protein